MEKPSDRAQKELDALDRELQSTSFDDAEIGKKLLSLKVMARTPPDAPCVYGKAGLKVLAEAAFGVGQANRPISSLEAARIIANALLLQDQTQQLFADLGYTRRLVDFYRQSDPDHEFVAGRILFLLTYKSKVDFVALIEVDHLLEHIRVHLEDHFAHLQRGDFTGNPMKSMALVETLKLLYNLASKFPAQMHFMSKTIGNLIDILTTIPPPAAPLDPPISQLLNALAVIDWPDPVKNGQDDLMLAFAERLVQILDRSTSSMKPAQLETMLISLTTVVGKLNEQPHAKVHELLRMSLIPQYEERDKPLGQSHTLASRLLRLQTSGGLTILPEAISSLLFDLSDRDATTFVHNIGYGHAAGYLMTHKIPIPENVRTTTGANGNANGKVDINPITGQRVDAETPVTMPEMSDAEKEQEAERLFILFERLKATGAVNVENPLRTAQQSGKLEELSDSEPD